jgi:midasin
MKKLEGSPPGPQTSSLKERWEKLDARLKRLNTQLRRLDSNAALAFAFVEGSLVRAVKNGDWILLDEINLATAETLDCLAGLIENFGDSKGPGKSPPVLLEAEDSSVERHPEFRLFACMNPATDVGKRDLPPGIRNR